MEGNIFEIQKSLEEEMVYTGIEKFQKQVREAKQKGTESITLHGILLMKKTVTTLSKAIHTHINEEVSKPGRMKASSPFLAMLENDVAAFISLRAIMDGISHSQKLMNLSHQIGQALSDQVRFNLWENQDKKYFRMLVEKIGKISASRHYRRYGLIRTASYKMGEEIPVWTHVEKTQVGQLMIDLIIRSTGLIKLGSTRSKGKKYSSYTIVPTQETLDMIQDIINQGELLSPAYLPMVTTPKKWTNPSNGGYLSHRLPFIKETHKNVKTDLPSSNMDMEFECVNSLQETKWKVNTKVLDVMEKAWEQGRIIGSMPDRNEMELPPRDFPKDLKKQDMDEETKLKFKAWKVKATQVYEENIRRKSQILQFMRTLNLAGKFKDFDQIYFPYQADFRGRKYTVSSFLTPQGTEYAKSLLTFGEGLPIENQEQADWLAIHGANCAGVDKVSFTERIQWVLDNEEHILKSAELGLDYDWWTQFDDAWIFFAFCSEWATLKRNGLGVLSYLPIALDGSNNGLQHYSAMLRCPIGGKATNLTNEPVPQDIYQEVADVVFRETKRLADLDDPIAKKWLESGLINRKMTKRPVMVVPYGGTRFSAMVYVEEYVKDQLRKGKEFEIPEGEKLFKYINWITTLVWSAIGEVIISAKEAMTWIRNVSSELSKRGYPVIWKTPTGLYIYQHYKAFKWRRIETTIDGKLLTPVIHEEDKKKIDVHRSINGSAPNFVHSLDASALTLTVHLCNKEEINSYAMIHDSYGTHAKNTPELAKLLREAFVDIYSKNDVLSDFREAALEVLDEVPEPPKLGNLNIYEVLNSPYFFC
jgi:DNA-directed RNA polymerase